jgi:rhodanese-related sulfurtransferase
MRHNPKKAKNRYLQEQLVDIVAVLLVSLFISVVLTNSWRLKKEQQERELQETATGTETGTKTGTETETTTGTTTGTTSELTAIINTKDLKEMIEKSKTLESEQMLILDSRDPLFYEVGHIPGSLNLPLEDFNNVYEILKPKIEEASTIVVYCARPSCTDSEKLETKLKNLGHKNIKIYKDGYEAWRENQ